MITVLLIIVALILLLPVTYFTANIIADLSYPFKPLLINNKKTPFYKWRPEDLGGGMQPWGAVMRSKYVGKLPLQMTFHDEKPCPLCAQKCPDEALTHLSWVYFKSHPRTWRIQCGREGYISICTKHKNQVGFICTAMN